MKTKKIWAVLLALIAASSLALAQDTTDKEVKDMTTPYGATVRMLQLQASVEKNLAAGEAALTAMQAMQGVDASELEAILAEMNVLKQEIQDIDLDDSPEELAQQFVELKNDAIDLTKQFRETSQTMLTTEQKNQVKNVVQQANKNENKQIREQIKELKNQYNSEKLGTLLNKTGIKADDLLGKVRQGQLNMSELKNQLKQKTGNLTKDQSEKLQFQVKEQALKQKVMVAAVKDKVAYNQLERETNRVQNRLEKAQELNLSDDAQTKMHARIEKNEQKQEMIMNRTQDRIEKVEAHTDKMIDKIENKSGKITEQGENYEEKAEETLEKLNQMQQDMGAGGKR